MKKKSSMYFFVTDTHAVSEEFTALPALALVMIGFSIFFVLSSHTLLSYQARMETLHDYHVAESIALKLTNPECFFIAPGGVVNLPVLRNSSEQLSDLGEYYRSSGFSFCIRITWVGNSNGPEEFLISEREETQQRIAVSKPVGVIVNEAQTFPGYLTIILWRNIS